MEREKMPYTQPDLSEILANEQSLNTNLGTAQTKLRAILDAEEIGYTQGDGVIPLIRKLPVPVPTTVEWNCYESWLTYSGPQTRRRSTDAYPVVRDQHGTYIPNVPVTVRRKPISGGSWSNYGTYISSHDTIDLYPDSNKDGYIYEVYVTANPSISAQLTLPQYWFNYDSRDEDFGVDYSMDAILDTANPLISVNVKSIDTTYLSYGTNYFYVTANAAGELLLAIPLKNVPTIVGANSNTNVYIGYDVTRGNAAYSDGALGIGGGMVGNGSRNSMGIFLNSSDFDFRATYMSTFYFAPTDEGFTVSGQSRECVVIIPGGSSGAYTYYENADGSISKYAGYWYASQLGSRYGPCLVVYKNKATANERIKVTVKYIKASCP